MSAAVGIEAYLPVLLLVVDRNLLLSQTCCSGWLRQDQNGGIRLLIRVDGFIARTHKQHNLIPHARILGLAQRS